MIYPILICSCFEHILCFWCIFYWMYIHRFICIYLMVTFTKQAQEKSCIVDFNLHLWPLSDPLLPASPGRSWRCATCSSTDKNRNIKMESLSWQNPFRLSLCQILANQHIFSLKKSIKHEFACRLEGIRNCGQRAETTIGEEAELFVDKAYLVSRNHD